MNSKEHNRLIGIFLMIHGGLQGMIMVLLSVIYGIIGAGIFATAKREEDQVVGMVFVGVIALVVIFSLIFIIPQVLGGWKMYKEKPNARIWGIIGSIISCMSFPLGTAAGVYGLWFLFGDEGKRFYDASPETRHLGSMNAQSEFQYNANREYQPHNWK